MSDIVVDLRKNTQKLRIICIFFAISIIISFLVVVNSDVNFSKISFTFSALINGKTSAKAFCVRLLFENALCLTIILLFTFGDKAANFWLLVFFFRELVRAYDVLVALKNALIAAFLPAIVFVIFDVAAVFLLNVIHIDVCERGVNVFERINLSELGKVVIPVAVLLLIVSVLQGVLVPIFAI